MNLIERYLNNNNAARNIDNIDIRTIIEDVNSGLTYMHTLDNVSSITVDRIETVTGDIYTSIEDDIDRIEQRIDSAENENITQNERIGILENIVASLDTRIDNYVQQEDFLSMLNYTLQNYSIDDSALRSLADMLRSYIGTD